MTFDQWYDRQPMVFFDRKTEHWLTWEAARGDVSKLEARIRELINQNDRLQDALTDAQDQKREALVECKEALVAAQAECEGNKLVFDICAEGLAAARRIEQ